MKSLFGSGLAVALIGSVVVLNGCKEQSQPAATTSSSAPASSATVAVATAPSTAKATNGETHDDLSPMGLPVYPNVVESGWTDTEAMRLLVGKDKLSGPRMRNGEMSTRDSFDVVYAWYHSKMPSGSEPAAAAASSHTTDEGERMALFEVGSNGDPTYQRVMLIRGKSDEYTLINLSGSVSR